MQFPASNYCVFTPIKDMDVRHVSFKLLGTGALTIYDSKATTPPYQV